MNLITNSQTMSSLEIADLIKAQHGNVRISIERLASKNVIQLPAMQLVENKQSLSANNKTNAYIFSGDRGKRDSIIVVAQLCPEFTATIVDRWQELESQVARPQPPACIEDQAANSLSAFLRVGGMLKVPEHIVQVEGVKNARLRYGVDYSVLLLSAPAQNDIQFEEEMLEPTELGKRFGYGAAKMNLLLCSFGLQSKVDGEWVPTDKGAGLSFHHQWQKGSKSGYNYKWRVAAIEDLLKEAA